MEDKKEVEKTEFAQMMQAENNMLMQAMSDEQLCEIVSNCLDELERREYSVLVSISNPDNEESTIYMNCFGAPHHLAAGLMYLSINRKLLGEVVTAVAGKLANERGFYERVLADEGLEADDEEAEGGDADE